MDSLKKYQRAMRTLEWAKTFTRDYNALEDIDLAIDALNLGFMASKPEGHRQSLTLIRQRMKLYSAMIKAVGRNISQLQEILHGLHEQIKLGEKLIKDLEGEDKERSKLRAEGRKPILR